MRPESGGARSNSRGDWESISSLKKVMGMLAVVEEGHGHACMLHANFYTKKIGLPLCILNLNINLLVVLLWSLGVM